METKEMICIGCPLGCPLNVTINEMNEAGIEVSGNTCPNGHTYAVNEVLHPERIITSTVPVTGSSDVRVAVKTAHSVPKGKIFECMDEIHRASVKAPVHIGDVVIKNIAGTGVDIIATSDAL
ncbi:MAG: DUF1667 domain-containing protein [Eubacteriales bacterium]|nr:DUF1667 domain-containing protein [Eubacteriales bacterium]